MGETSMIERHGLMKFHGKDVSIQGKDLQVGDEAPEFSVVNQDWEVVKIMENTKGKVRILAAVPSIDTDVCDRETRRFNMEAAQLSKEIMIIVISADLPFAQKRWCGAAGVDQVMVVSDHKNAEFGEKYACLLREPRILRRAVFVVDKEQKIRHVQYLPELGMEPEYKSVLAAARSAL
jgi:thioredoxin-dependent peroxiredoxin